MFLLPAFQNEKKNEALAIYVSKIVFSSEPLKEKRPAYIHTKHYWNLIQ